MNAKELRGKYGRAVDSQDLTEFCKMVDEVGAKVKDSECRMGDQLDIDAWVEEWGENPDIQNRAGLFLRMRLLAEEQQAKLEAIGEECDRVIQYTQYTHMASVGQLMEGIKRILEGKDE